MSADIIIFFLSNIKIDEDKVEIKEKQWRILKIQGMKVPNRACVTNLTLLGTNIMIKVWFGTCVPWNIFIRFLNVFSRTKNIRINILFADVYDLKTEYIWEKNWVFAENSNFLIPISLKPNKSYFKIRLFVETEFIV